MQSVKDVYPQSTCLQFQAVINADETYTWFIMGMAFAKVKIVDFICSSPILFKTIFTF